MVNDNEFITIPLNQRINLHLSIKRNLSIEHSKIQQRKVMMFTKRRHPACDRARQILERYSMTPDIYEVCEIDRRHDCSLIENHFLVICLASQRSVPQLFVDGRYIGDGAEIQRMHESGELTDILRDSGASFSKG